MIHLVNYQIKLLMKILLTNVIQTLKLLRMLNRVGGVTMTIQYHIPLTFIMTLFLLLIG